MLRVAARHARISVRYLFVDANASAARAERALDKGVVAEAVRHARDAAAEGSARGATILGCLARGGVGVVQDAAEAERLLRVGADAGDPFGQAALGGLLIDKLGEVAESVEGDIVLDIGDDGVPRPRVEFKGATGGEGDAPTPAELVRRVRKARKKAGFTDAQAREYEEFREAEEQKKRDAEREQALNWLRAAVDQNHAPAMVTLGNAILDEDPVNAVHLYERAVKTSRDTDAYFNLGQIYTKGLPGIEPDSKAALKNFAMAAQLGDASAQFYMGHMYRVGSEDVKVDLESSRQYVELAAEQNHPGALFYLALMHRNGEGGLEANEGAFRRYLQRSVDIGHGPAASCLADMFYKGTDGTDVDYERALELFTKAGRAGESEALCSAAAMHFHGLGTPKDDHKAFLLYQDAAQIGSIAAMQNLGSMYYHGEGVPRSKTVAEHFFKMVDKMQQQIQDEAAAHQQVGIKRTSAPKHPMTDIPRHVKEGQE